MSDIELHQGRVTVVGGARVGVMRIWDDDFVVADGSPRHGLTARLSVAEPPANHVVGEGSRFAVNGVEFDVIAVGRETVTLRQR